ncbi:MAG: glycosyltransferase family 2 protein [Kiritimatiellia bacterium]
MTALVVFCSGILAYLFLVYPAVLFLLALRRPVPQASGYEPGVSILIPVYNEECIVRAKLENCLALDYPPEKLEIVFVSDGSTDRTADILRASAGGRVKIVDCPVNRGKTAVLNEAIPTLRGEVVILTDASGLLNPEAVRRLAAHFADEQIGCVCGIYHIVKEGRSQLDSSESSYHGFEMKLRMWEGRIWTTLSGTGALCAFRRADYKPLPDGLINEDYVLPARIALGGRRVIYESGAHIHDKITTGLRQVFRRRVRIAYGNWQQLAFLKQLLNPRRGYLAWIFYSHKVLRMALPFVLLAMLVSAALITPAAAWAMMALLAAGLAAGLVSLWLDRCMSGHNPFGFVVVFFINCVAVFIGTFKFLSGQRVRW